MEQPLIVVTGASGRVGQNVVSHLVRHHYPLIRAAFHHLADAARLPENVERAPIEYHDPASVLAALKGAERLFLLTPGGIQQTEETRVLVEAAAQVGIKHIVKVGTLKCDEPPILPTDVQSSSAEQLIRASGGDFTFLRCSFFNQLFVSPEALEQVRAGAGFTALCDGSTGWVDCRDVGEAAANVLMAPEKHRGKIYDLTGPACLSFDDIRAIMTRVSGAPVPFIKLSENMLSQIYANESDATIEARLGCLVKLREGYIAYVTPHLRTLLGRAPRTFEDFARDHAHLLFPDLADREPPSLYDDATLHL